eukprot:gene23860-biopygen14905
MVWVAILGIRTACKLRNLSSPPPPPVRGLPPDAPKPGVAPGQSKDPTKAFCGVSMSLYFLLNCDTRSGQKSNAKTLVSPPPGTADVSASAGALGVFSGRHSFQWRSLLPEDPNSRRTNRKNAAGGMPGTVDFHCRLGFRGGGGLAQASRGVPHRQNHTMFVCDAGELSVLHSIPLGANYPQFRRLRCWFAWFGLVRPGPWSVVGRSRRACEATVPPSPFCDFGSACGAAFHFLLFFVGAAPAAPQLTQCTTCRGPGPGANLAGAKSSQHGNIPGGQKAPLPLARLCTSSPRRCCVAACTGCTSHAFVNCMYWGIPPLPVPVILPPPIGQNPNCNIGRPPDNH